MIHLDLGSKYSLNALTITPLAMASLINVAINGSTLSLGLKELTWSSATKWI